jgi:isoquinoline 1-oxidoreductase beta subunit
VPEAPTLKTRDQFRYIGKPLPRHDQRDIVTGKRVYGADVKLPGMKYAAIRHVPVMGGKHSNPWTSPLIEGMKRHRRRGRDPALRRSLRLARRRGRRGRRPPGPRSRQWPSSTVEWDRGPHGDYDTDAYKAMLVRHVEQPCDAAFARGDVDAALSQATVRHAGTYVGGHLSHSPMEPMASAAWVTDERCEIWASTQDPQGIQQTIGKYLGRKPTDIIVHVMAAGGAFGRKFKCDYVQEAVAISRAIGAPVQLTWSREEDTRTGYYHSCSAQYLEAGLDADGNVTGWLHRAAFPPIPSTFNPAVTRPGERDLSRITAHPFGIANVRVEAGEAPAHTRIGWYRAVYDIFWAHAINVFIDELAEKAGTDNVTLLRRIYRNSSDPSQREQAARSLAVLEKAVAMSEWGRELAKGHGIGVAVHHSYESYTAMAVHAEVDEDGAVRVHRVDCAVDCGLVLNPDIATAQMEGAVIMGLGLSLHTEVRFKDGAVVNSNFHDSIAVEPVEQLDPER